ncbi:zinc finger protein 354A-like [Vanessa atalanta]|uniref:zinc finger protein 354A-like n=1 Tax=Vanessa atalanta TaxID=42275 RepID=UPI001FCE1D33|nr:zinc finger protein 354A-like [Vanessa atalanta]
MDENHEAVIHSICCTCLSVDRKLTQLCRVENGVNCLFFLLSHDSEAYQAMFQKGAVDLHICWECRALMHRFCKFRDQACIAQKQLSSITDGRHEIKMQNTLSKLSQYHRDTYNDTIVSNDDIPYNFIDCGPDMDHIKTEFDNDIPLLEIPILETNLVEKTVNMKENNTDDTKVRDNQLKIEIKPLLKNIKSNLKKENTVEKDRLIRKRKKMISKEVDSSDEEVNYSTIEMSEKEMLECREAMRVLGSYVNASNKCESCVEGFKDYNELEKHNLELHVQKPRYMQCDICLVYIKYWWLAEHRKEHYTRYRCNYCEHTTANVLEILKHLKTVHGTGNVVSRIWQRVKRRAVQTNPALKTRRTEKPEVKTPFGYLCYECNKYFENKYLRYKHILKFHREGFKCKTCGKTFAFKNTLNKHEQVHAPPLPREKCSICDKMVRIDRVKTHARIHSERKRFDCVACDKRFVSLDSYEKHLKNSSVHAVHDVHKYKCTMCEKGFRTITELNDHTNYIHMKRTHHKCPICNKALATRRGVTRHVRRAHQGLKEKIGDKILCQTCGKAFRDKKCLQEHELIHTGERPLSCDICGRTFRQSACLYTHKRRVHKVAPKRQITHTEDVNVLDIKVS